MRARFLLWTIIAILAGGAAVSIRLWLAQSDKAWAQTQAQAKKPITDQQLVETSRMLYGLNATASPGVAPFELKRPVRLALGSLGLPNDEQNGRLSDLVLAELNGAQGLNLVERQSLETVLHELNLSWSGLVRAKDAVRAGKLLKADWFLLGTLATINGANSIVLRVVDVRTGILRDAGVFSGDKPLAQLARDIAAFARQSRQNAASGKTPLFLAIGTFEDLSINNRQAGFPTQLRGYLTAAYQGSGVTLLEREYVDVLLQEVRFDLAGLTDESATNAPAPVQSAYWLVNGYYQSFETTNLEIELTLDVQRIFGSLKRVSLRGPPGEPVSRQIKQVIDGMMNQNQGIVVPTRISEIRAQMSLGKDLALTDLFQPERAMFLVSPQYAEEKYRDDTGNMKLPESLKRRRNLGEAIRAFETVLLLDPGNREAEMYLAACLDDPIMDRAEDARHYYREIIEADVKDNWSGPARKALIQSFVNQLGRLENPMEKARWFESAAQQSNHSSVAEFYAKQAKEAEDDATMTPEQRLFGDLQSYNNALHGKPGAYAEEMGMYKFVTSYGADGAAARRLVELLPKMRTQFPDMEPYFMAMVARFQVDTNAPIIAEFQHKLAQIAEHSDQVLAPKQFWPDLLPLCYWCFDHRLYGVVAQMLEGRRRAASEDKTIPYIYQSANEDSIALAYAYQGMEHWQQARDIFETFSNQPMFMFHHGPWGPGLNTVLTGKEAEFCAGKVGQTPVRDAREFDMGRACFSLCTPSAFLADESGLWIGINNQLLHLDFDLKTNLAVTLPKEAGTSVCSLCFTASTVWIGTDGGGLIEFDKTSHQCRRMTEQDGLLMNNISCLHRDGTVLWIGYGHRTYQYSGIGITGEGGLGRLDLSTRQFESFTPSIQDRMPMFLEAADKPTRRPVIVLAQGEEDDVWFVTEENGTRLRRHRTRENTWEAGPQNSSSLAVDSKRLFLGQYWNYTGGDKGDQLGVRILDFKDGQWRTLKTIEALPPGAVSTVAPDGNNLWVGGRGYIALVDLEQGKVRKFARVPANAVDQIQIGGGYLWAQYDSHLHRALLQSIW